MKVPQTPKKMPKQCQTGIKMDISRFRQVSPNEEKLGILSQVSPTFLLNFPECIRTHVNQMRRVQKAGVTDLENQMEQTEFASCHLIDIEKAIDSLLLKENSRMKV